MQRIKYWILKPFSHFKTSIMAFWTTQGILTALYVYMGYGYQTCISTFIHTVVATLTLTIPKFVKDECLGKETWLDLTILAHMFIAYLFVGVLISMIYRKISRG